MIAVVLLRRSDAPWAKSRPRLPGAGGLRHRDADVLPDPDRGRRPAPPCCSPLPEVPLPAWAAGIRLGGPVTAEALAYTVYDAAPARGDAAVHRRRERSGQPPAGAPLGARSAVRGVRRGRGCAVGGATADRVGPAHPSRPAAPRRRRTGGCGPSVGSRLPSSPTPIERSISLAAGMESRGFARTRGLNVRGTLPMMLASVLLATWGGFLMLSTGDRWLAGALMVAGVAGTALGLRRAGARFGRHALPSARVAGGGRRSSRPVGSGRW